MMYGVNKKLVVFGLIVVVLGLCVNAMLGCDSDIPVVYEDEVVVDYTDTE